MAGFVPKSKFTTWPKYLKKILSFMTEPDNILVCSGNPRSKILL